MGKTRDRCEHGAVIRLERIAWHIVRGRLAGGVEQARRQWRERSGLWLKLEDRDGVVGQGEASPLPGFSPDTLERVIAALEPWAAEFQATASRWILDETAPLRSQIRSVVDTLPDEVPALRFAVETALFDLLGQRLRKPYSRLLSDDSDPTPIPLAALITTLDSRLARSQARAALDRGLRHLKVKIGRREAWRQELALLRELRDAFGDELILRLDANGMLPPEHLDERLESLATCGPELLEEPVSSSTLVALAEAGQLRSPVPLALDETLLVAGAFERLVPWMRAGGCRALVLKPMVLGGALPCLELAERARRLGVASLVTHLFDGPIARAAAAGLALALPGERLACGLDEHPGLAIWPAAGSSMLARDRVAGSDRFGLGIEGLSDGADPGRALG